MQAIQFQTYGGPDVLQTIEPQLGEPKSNEVLIRHGAVGVNFIDTYHRTGLYPVDDFPSGLGVEGAGVVEAAGPDSRFHVGDRVAYAGGPLGSYASHRILPDDRLVLLPDDIEERTAAAMMLKGLTAHYLIRRTYAVKKGDTILAYAAAGGVGQILCQWAHHLGATVIGVVGSDAKAELAQARGCAHVINYRQQDILQQVRQITNGQGVPVVYDSVGKDTFFTSLDCLQPLGMMVTYGNASGKPPELAVHELTARGSLFLTRPTLASYTATREQLEENAAELFDVVASGAVQIQIGQTWPLSEAGQAHTALEAGQTTGSTLLSV